MFLMYNVLLYLKTIIMAFHLILLIIFLGETMRLNWKFKLENTVYC